MKLFGVIKEYAFGAILLIICSPLVLTAIFAFFAGSHVVYSLPEWFVIWSMAPILIVIVVGTGQMILEKLTHKKEGRAKNAENKEVTETMTEEVKRITFQTTRSNKTQYAQIKYDGSLEVGASDTGEVAGTFMGGDYEYWVAVPPSTKDALLLALLEKSFGGEEDAVEAFKEFVKEKGLTHKFDNWVWMD